VTVQTVQGPVEPDTLGVTLTHEHVLLDLRNQFTDFDDPDKQRDALAPLRQSNLSLVRNNPYAVRDNLLLDDVDLACQELTLFRQAGGQTVVECTSEGIAPEPTKLRAIAERTGLNLIAGCGYYTQDTHPPSVADDSVEALTERLLRDLTAGIGQTNIRAGVIGEIGLSHPIHPDEHKCLVAAGRASAQTGAAVYAHTYPWGREGPEAARTLLDAGTDPAKIVICHVDVDFDVDYLRNILDLGVFVEFDNFGKEFSLKAQENDLAGGAFATDAARAQMVRAICDWGCGKQLLITNDICLKSMLRHYGGRGYAHILEGIAGMLIGLGLEQNDIDTLLIRNPRTLLDTKKETRS